MPAARFVWAWLQAPQRHCPATSAPRRSSQTDYSLTTLTMLSAYSCVPVNDRNVLEERAFTFSSAHALKQVRVRVGSGRQSIAPLSPRQPMKRAIPHRAKLRWALPWNRSIGHCHSRLGFPSSSSVRNYRHNQTGTCPHNGGHL